MDRLSNFKLALRVCYGAALAFIVIQLQIFVELGSVAYLDLGFGLLIRPFWVMFVFPFVGFLTSAGLLFAAVFMALLFVQYKTYNPYYLSHIVCTDMLLWFVYGSWCTMLPSIAGV